MKIIDLKTPYLGYWKVWKRLKTKKEGFGQIVNYIIK